MYICYIGCFKIDTYRGFANGAVPHDIQTHAASVHLYYVNMYRARGSIM